MPWLFIAFLVEMFPFRLATISVPPLGVQKTNRAKRKMRNECGWWLCYSWLVGSASCRLVQYKCMTGLVCKCVSDEIIDKLIWSMCRTAPKSQFRARVRSVGSAIPAKWHATISDLANNGDNWMTHRVGMLCFTIVMNYVLRLVALYTEWGEQL